MRDVCETEREAASLLFSVPASGRSAKRTKVEEPGPEASKTEAERDGGWPSVSGYRVG